MMSLIGDPCHPSRVTRTVTMMFVAIAVVVAGCGEAGLLDGVGDRTRSVVVGETTTTLPPITVAAGEVDEALVNATDVLWFNDELGGSAEGDADAVIASVWERQGNSRFVQSSRREISLAVPALGFPSLVPDQVQWVTSQLVYNQTSGTLDPDTSAAFGMWSAEPYTTNTAQLAVLRVGRAALDIPSARSDLTVVAVPDGVSVGWTESGLRYELFCRTEVSEELCRETAESSVLLAGLLPSPR